MVHYLITSWGRKPLTRSLQKPVDPNIAYTKHWREYCCSTKILQLPPLSSHASFCSCSALQSRFITRNVTWNPRVWYMSAHIVGWRSLNLWPNGRSLCPCWRPCRNKIFHWGCHDIFSPHFCYLLLLICIKASYSLPGRLFKTNVTWCDIMVLYLSNVIFQPSYFPTHQLRTMVIPHISSFWSRCPMFPKIILSSADIFYRYWFCYL